MTPRPTQNVANMLKGLPRTGSATAEMLDWLADQLTWLKPRFQKQFPTQTDEKLIIDGLSNLEMSLNETMGELLASDHQGSSRRATWHTKTKLRPLLRM
jgi:hypothetical protein